MKLKKLVSAVVCVKTCLRVGLMCVFAILVLSCGTSKKAVAPAVESSKTVTKNLEGEKVSVETVKLTGIEMAESLNEDGTDLIKRPYKWFAGIATADNKQMAIELAQREAYATISRVLSNAVEDKAEKGAVLVNSKVQQSVTSHWEQFSISLQKACEPLGNTTIEYNPQTKMYTATAKVGIRGDRFNQLLNSAGDFKPSDLTGEDLAEFIKINKEIMEAARGN